MENISPQSRGNTSRNLNGSTAVFYYSYEVSEMALSEHQVRERDFFFGRGRYRNRSNGFLSYDSILSENEIIIRTDNVVSIINANNEVQYLLLVANNRCIYLDFYRQVKKITYFRDGEKKRAWLVKLFRGRFKPYYCKRFEGYDFEGEVSFDGFYEMARIQGLANEKVRIG